MSALQRAKTLLFDTRRPDLAEAELRKALAENPEDGYAHTLLAHCLGQQNKDQAAAEEIAEALRFTPDSSLAHQVRGWLLGRSKRFTEAEAAYRESLRLEPDEDTFGGLAWVLLAQNRPKAALAAADEGLALAPDSVECLNLRAEALLELRITIKEAQAAVTASLRIDPTRGWTHAIQGRIFRQRLRYLSALRSFHTALQLDPGDNWPLDHAREVLTIPRRFFFVVGLVAGLAWLYFMLRVSNAPSPWHERQRVRAIAFLSANWWLFGLVMRHHAVETAVFGMTAFRRLLGDPIELQRCRRIALLVMAIGTMALLPLAGFLPEAIAAGLMVIVLVVGVPVLAALRGTRQVSQWRRLGEASLLLAAATPALWLVLGQGATEGHFQAVVLGYGGFFGLMCLWTLFTMDATRAETHFPDDGSSKAVGLLIVFATFFALIWWWWENTAHLLPPPRLPEVISEEYHFRLKDPGRGWNLLSSEETRQLDANAIAAARQSPHLYGFVRANRLPLVVNPEGADERLAREIIAELKWTNVQMVEEVKAIVFQGKSAIRYQLTGVNEPRNHMRLQNTLFIRDGIVYQITVTGTESYTEPDGSSFRAFEEAFEFLVRK